MEVEKIMEEYYEIYDDLKSQRDEFDHQSCVLATTAILQELGKYRRSKFLSGLRNDSNGEPATEKQKNALRKFGIAIEKGITKKEASVLLSEAIENSNNSRK